MITTELLLVRHGQARCNVAGIVGGPRTCTGLTDQGRIEIQLAADRIAAEYPGTPHITTVYTGPRLRLRQSAEILAHTLKVPVVVEPGLDGPIHGDADGRTWREITANFRGHPQAHPDRPWAASSDTWNNFLSRATAFLAELLSRVASQRILVAAHGETVIAAHSLLLSLPLGSPVRFTVDHASLTRWQHQHNRFGHESWWLDCHNDTSHLDMRRHGARGGRSTPCSEGQTTDVKEQTG
ncbi:histidine phosphatase family protein [Actinophytocola sp.]|uniref:histidine phosphatase family protein n=1 Tax=Actinophytocola sp. TaxID=1872138 RepID=UPI00389AABDD